MTAQNKAFSISDAPASEPVSQGRRRPLPLRNPLPFIVLAVGLVFTVAVFLQSRRAARLAAADRFRLLQTQMAEQVRTRLQSYESILRGALGFFDGSQNVDRQEWRTYVSHLEIHDVFPGIQGIGYALAFTPEKLDEVERRVRAEGFPTFSVHPAGPRPFYAAIVYLEPFADRNLRAFGYDMFSEPVRRRAMERARDEGAIAITERVRLVQEMSRDVQQGFLMYLPHYQRGQPANSAAERRAALVGYIYAPFRMDDFMRGTLGTFRHDIRLRIYDGPSATPARVLFDSLPRSAVEEASTPTSTGATQLPIFGWTWTLRFDSEPSFHEGEAAGAWVAAIVCLLISVLLFAIVLQVTTTRRRALGLAERMTAAARASEARLREAMTAMEAARDMALEANRAKSDFLATMSHEIRTPLNGILGTTQLLGDGAVTTEQRRYLATIRHCASSLLVIINGLLDLSKVEAGKLELESVSFSLSELIAVAMAMFEERARGKGIALSWEVAPQLPLWVEGDPLRLQQVLVNLVSNALKFTSQGRVLIRVEREPGPPSALVRFTVEDTGEGITPEARERLFQAFSQADTSTSRTHGGTGLGLVICQKLAALMGGRIDFESEPGRGSTFWFTAQLPQAEPATRDNALPADTVAVPALENAVPLPLPSLEESRTTAPARVPPAAAHVLLVEDNPINQMIARAMLVKRGLVVQTAANGRLALEALEKNTFDLVLMDCQMPEMDGFEATGVIRRQSGGPRRIPIVALTANAMMSDRARCLEAGMDDYLTKPLDTSELDRVLKRWLVSANPKVPGS